MKRKHHQTPVIFVIVFCMMVILAGYSWFFAPRTPDLPSPPLKDLAAAHGIELGNYAALNKLNNKIYTGILTSQYAFVTLDGDGNWAYSDGALRPSPTKYNYSNIDKVISFAKAHSMPVQFHHLVWGEAKWLPRWLKNGHFSRSQLLDIIHSHIANVVGHYKGQIQTYSVVNEAFTRAQHVYGLHDWWADRIGDTSYIDAAFIWAHQADPRAALILNDFNNEEENDVSNAEYNYVKSAKARGIPIDAIGMQMHINAAHPPDKQKVITNMQRFAAIGVKTYVTEFDVNLNYVKGSRAYKNQLQAQIAYNMVRACIESKSCPSFAELGIADRPNTSNLIGLKKPHSYLFTSDYKPKPAFNSFRQAWAQN